MPLRIILFLFLLYPISARSQPVLGTIIYATATYLTGDAGSLDSIVHYFQKVDSSIRYRSIIPVVNSIGASNGLDSEFEFFIVEQAAEVPLLTLSYFAFKSPDRDIVAMARFTMAGGYTVKGKKVTFNQKSLYQVTIMELKQLFGMYTQGASNKLSKESKRYVFAYQNTRTKRKAKIGVSCVYEAKSTYNYISTISVYVY